MRRFVLFFFCFCCCLVAICWHLKCKTFVLSSMRSKAFLRTTLRMSNALMNFLFAIEVWSIYMLHLLHTGVCACMCAYLSGGNERLESETF